MAALIFFTLVVIPLAILIKSMVCDWWDGQPSSAYQHKLKADRAANAAHTAELIRARRESTDTVIRELNERIEARRRGETWPDKFQAEFDRIASKPLNRVEGLKMAHQLRNSMFKESN